ncbi:hypothetical protein PVIIG_05157 [Plasmodium vivax India VII]|nr:hypothetical protein PVIIG_05157 [Plasmodium vivax India VII]KMZ83523.1 hypothetical protein PVBG_00603 [Plasmodium vivax Brazil I]KMZ91070.1 hypothetical protein PVMG_04842 [Plasmodium vivax Mauritania I]SCA83436.1 tryptophan-rich antigen [Plasmodium vivax]
MKIMFLLSYIPCTLSILSSASEVVPALNEYFQKYKTKMKTRGYQESTSLQNSEFRDRPEKWKEDQWNDFMKETERDWEKFNTSMENLTSSWFEKKELEWEGWIKAMQNRWAYYNKNMDDCVLNVIKNSLNWTDFQWQKWIRLMKNKAMKHFESSGDEYILDVFRRNTSWTTEQWKEWIKTPIRESMEKDWEYWIAEDQYKLDNWMLENFDKWKTKRITEWKEKKWKAEEDEYWANWEAKGSKDKSKVLIDRKNWNLWKERTYREERQWEMYTERKKKEFFSKDVVEWMKWKSEKTEMFENWKENTLSTWIKEKQWNVWLHKDKEVGRRKLY